MPGRTTAIKFICVILCLLIAAAEAGGEGVFSPRNSTWVSHSPGGLWLSMNGSFGRGFYSGQVGESFADGKVFTMHGGICYWRLKTGLTFRFGPSGLSEGFADRSGYPLSYLDLRSFSTTLLLGCTLYEKNRYRVTTVAGLRWDRVFEISQYWYDSHPNWDLSANSRAQPLVGVQLDFNYVRYDRRGGLDCLWHWLFVRMSINRFEFDNPEYGSGTGFEIGLGHAIDFLAWRGKKRPTIWDKGGAGTGGSSE